MKNSMLLIEVEWRDGDKVERESFGGFASFNQLLEQAENHFKDRNGEGEVVRYVNGDVEVSI